MISNISVDFNNELKKNDDFLEEKEIDVYRLNFFWDENSLDLSSNMRLDDFQNVMQYKSHYFNNCGRSYDYEMDNYSAKNLELLNKHAFNFNYELFDI